MTKTALYTHTPTTRYRGYTLWIDLDGVLADFAAGMRRIWPGWEEHRGDTDKAYDTETFRRIAEYQETHPFWFNLPLTRDAKALWEFCLPYEPIILTAVGDQRFKAQLQKLAWVHKHFGPAVRVSCCRKSRDKATLVRPLFTDLLIDDREKATDPWLAAGGQAILHRTAAHTITVLKHLGW